VPFWMIWAMAGWRKMLQVWPACLACGATFATVQFLVSNYHGPWVVDIAASMASILALLILLKFWQPREIERQHQTEETIAKPSPKEAMIAWMPWIILSVVVFVWGLPQVKTWLNNISLINITVPYLHNQVLRVPPVVGQPKAEEAVFALNWLSATGTGLLLSGIIGGLLLGLSPLKLLRIFGHTVWRVRYSLLTIAAMLSLGFTTRYAGLDATMGLAFASTRRISRTTC